MQNSELRMNRVFTPGFLRELIVQVESWVRTRESLWVSLDSAFCILRSELIVLPNHESSR